MFDVDKLDDVSVHSFGSLVLAFQSRRRLVGLAVVSSHGITTFVADDSDRDGFRSVPVMGDKDRNVRRRRGQL